MRVTIDLMKKSTQIIDLSNVINPRVGDDDLLLPLHICYGDNLYDMRGKDVEFLSQDANNQSIYVAGTCSTDTPGDNLYMGDLTFRFPAGTFKVDGTYDPDQTMFRIVDKATQKVISSVNVKITVMKNAIEFNFDPDKSSYNSRAETMLQDFHDKGQTLLDEIKDLNNQAKSNVSGDTAATANQAKQQANANAGDISDLKGEVTSARGRFADLPSREDAQDAAINQKESIANANANYAALQQKDAQQDAILINKANKFELENKLAQINLQPETFGSVDALKSKYPNGETRLAMVADNDGANFYYYDSTAQAWTKGSSFLNTDGIQISEAIESHENYIPNSSFTTLELPQTTQEATSSTISVTKSIGTLFPGRKCIHLEVSGSGGIVYNFDPANPNYQDFENHDKRFGCLLKNDSGEVRSFTVQLVVMNGDNSNESRGYTIDNRNIGPAKLYQILFDFSLPLPKFYVHTVYQIRIIHDDAKTGAFDIAMPCLQDIYAKLNHDENTLIQSGDDVENWGTSQILSEARPNGAWYHVMQKDYNNASDVGIAWHKAIETNTFQTNNKLKLSTTLVNDTDSVKAINLQLWETDQTLNPLYQNNIKTVIALPHTEVNVDEVFEIIPNASATKVILMAMEQNAKNTDFYISRKTRVDFVSNSQTVNDNLLGDYRRNTYIYGGTTILDNYNGVSSVHINFSENSNWPQCVLPFTASQVGIYEAHLKLVSQSAQVLPLQLKRFLANGSEQVEANYRSINLQANTPKTIDFDVQITDTTGLYQSLLIFMEKGPADFQILEASLKPKTIEIDSGTNNLPTFNLIAPLDETGALTKGFVEIGRGNVIRRYPATFKTQGNSTKLFPKKSWRITFYTADDYQTKQEVSIFPDYPAVNALNMKANYIDWTQANNILVSQYIADLTQLTNEVDDNQRHANNQCQITGEPVLGFNNGQKLGLFTISPKKSNDMFNMTKGNQNQAVFEGNLGDGAICFKADSAVFDQAKDFSIEAPDDNVSQAIKDSFNSLLKLTNSGTDDEFKAQIGDKLNLRSVANWIVMITVFGLEDDIAKNICWATWDGVKWNAVMYDHDLAWGMIWDGSGLTGAARDDALQSYMNRNKLVSRLIHLHIIDDLLIDSFTKFSQAHNWLSIQQRFRQYYYWIGESNYIEDKELWPQMPGQEWMPASYVLSYIRVRMELCAKWFTEDYLAKL